MHPRVKVGCIFAGGVQRENLQFYGPMNLELFIQKVNMKRYTINPKRIRLLGRGLKSWADL